jgi:hypothetical protein
VKAGLKVDVYADFKNDCKLLKVRWKILNTTGDAKGHIQLEHFNKKSRSSSPGEILSGLNRKVKHQKLSGRGRSLERQILE